MGSIEDYQFVKEYLGALIDVSEANERAIWSNAEAFEFVHWGKGTNCETIQSADTERFVEQLQVEADMGIASLISWEFHAYISPYSGPCEWSDRAHEFYANYKM